MFLPLAPGCRDILIAPGLLGLGGSLTGRGGVAVRLDRPAIAPLRSGRGAGAVRGQAAQNLRPHHRPQLGAYGGLERLPRRALRRRLNIGNKLGDPAQLL